VFAREAFGEYAGFVIGWSDWISSAASVAAVALLVGEYSAALVPALGKRAAAVAVAVVLAFTVLQWRGVRWGDRVQQTTSLLKALAFVALIAACFALVPAPSTSLPAPDAAAAPTTAPFTVAAVVLAMQSVIFTYDGWTGMLYFSGEVREPGRQIPRAMLGGVLAVIAIYVLVNVAFLRVLGIGGIARSDFAAGAAARALWGSTGDTVIRALVVVALLSAVNALLLLTSRVPFAMSRDGLFPRQGATVNAGGTPTTALALTGVAAVALLLTGTFESVIAVAAFFFVLNYVASFAAVFALRRRLPGAPRPYRAWGYPWTTAVSLLGGLAFLVGATLSDRRNSLVALGILAASYPVYAITVRRRGLNCSW
jgi:APA family basic amino acid/polyamine antiporter